MTAVTVVAKSTLVTVVAGLPLRNVVDDTSCFRVAVVGRTRVVVTAVQSGLWHTNLILADISLRTLVAIVALLTV